MNKPKILRPSWAWWIHRFGHWRRRFIHNVCNFVRERFFEMRLLSAAMGSPDINSDVWLDGEKVSCDCVEAYVPAKPGVIKPGWARLYERKGGNIFRRGNGPATKRRFGLVRWEPSE